MVVKKIEEESYSSLERYLNRSLQYITYITKPYFMEFKNKKFFVTGCDDFSVLIGDRDNYVVFYNDSNIRQFVKNYNKYVIQTKGEKSVKKVDLRTQKEDIVFLRKAQDEVLFNYFQRLNNNFIDFQYDLTDIDERLLNQHISYMSQSSPNRIYSKRGLKFGSYMLGENKTYSPYICLFKHYLINARLQYRMWELFPKEIGVSSVIPKELLDLYTSDDREFKDVEIVSNAYKVLRKN